MVKKVAVDLGERSYTITIGYDILEKCTWELGTFPVEKEAFLLSDRVVYKHHGYFLEKLLVAQGFNVRTFLLPPGEEAKSWEQAGKILERMLAENLGRKAPVLALGGGVVGDLAGFVAALYRRGVPLIQIPTTLLAQVDSSVGGKVAVNHSLGKNMLGTFYQPLAVWADLRTLDTLSDSEWRAGLAEVIKYGVIWDETFFAFLESRTPEILRRDPAVLPEIIQRCCQIKAEVVSLDEKDEGLRNILNFGHTLGHALESATHYQEYRHGEAVAIGMCGAMELAHALGMIEKETASRVRNILERWGLPTSFPAKFLETVIQNLIYDKKVSAKKILFILPSAIGKVEMVRDIPPEIIRSVVQANLTA